jgi:serine/threonine-protein kinase HipA
MSEQLIALHEDRLVGRVLCDSAGRLSFIYEEGWRADAHGFPLSLSMPWVTVQHGHAAIEAFLWNLLPDSAEIQQRWAQQFGVRDKDAFALVRHVGTDCAGAIRFLSPQSLNGGDQTEITWLDAAAMATRLKALRRDPAAARLPQDASWFTLAGAQPKTALFGDGDRFGVPSGRIPTTHILKQPNADREGHAENEHFCLALAARIGLPAARSEVRQFEDETALVVTRFDRQVQGGSVRRLHQEDLCQALGLMPSWKYQSQGGPEASAITRLLQTVSQQPERDVARFTDALAFNWLIGNVDAHAKNYALMIESGGRAALAPLYDLWSMLPYENEPARIRPAMTPGGEERLSSLAAALPDHANDVRRELAAAGLDHPVIGRLAERVAVRAQHCDALLEASRATNVVS